MTQRFHLAQVNVARLRAPLDDPLLTGFVARLDDVNALADAAGHIPSVAEATSRLEHLRAHGESAHAFSFAKLYPAPDSADPRPRVGFADPCPST